jgi:uncharacterized membrane protein
MEQFIIMFILNIVCIIVFSFIYNRLSSENIQIYTSEGKSEYIDYLYFSTNIQSGVGLSDFNIKTRKAKMAVMVHELTVILLNIVLFYVAAQFINLL